MKKDQNKKEILANYKERKIIGAVYEIRRTDSNKRLIETTQDLQAAKNRFEFSKKTDRCLNLKLINDWTTLGKDFFVFEVLEELKKEENQSTKAFKEDLEVLKLIWMDKFLMLY